MYVNRFVANARAVIRVNLSEHVCHVISAAVILGVRPVLITIRSPEDPEARRPFVNVFSVVARATK
jgi:2-keto-3-deoxy-6-phosphogluconate aldolase